MLWKQKDTVRDKRNENKQESISTSIQKVFSCSFFGIKWVLANTLPDEINENKGDFGVITTSTQKTVFHAH